jgi:integral membrane protein (TIGR00529 family)
MADMVKILLVLAVIILLLKRRWNLGIVMALSSVLLALLYLLSPRQYLDAFLAASTDMTTLRLLIALTLIRVFENVMRTQGIMQEMMESFRGMVMDRRILMAAMPALIGLLPSMGGAMFSAPMVEEASKGITISPEKKAYVNYIFRHPWEYVSPLYPGLILAAAITAFPLRDLILANIPYALALTLGGVLWGLTGIGRQREGFRRISRRGLASFLPLVSILLLVMVFHLNLSLSMGLVIAGLYIVFRYPLKAIIQSIREGFSRDIVVIILGVMTFKAVLTSSGAVTNISALFASNGIPLFPVLFALPFISGVLTGLTVGFVGSTFPLLWGLEGAQSLNAMAFAFASGYAGVLLSPVHLCLVLTREYFGANMAGIYRNILRASMLIIAAAVLVYFLRAPA